jgi:hypothetical protein
VTLSVDRTGTADARLARVEHWARMIHRLGPSGHQRFLLGYEREGANAARGRHKSGYIRSGAG